MFFVVKPEVWLYHSGFKLVWLVLAAVLLVSCGGGGSGGGSDDSDKSSTSSSSQNATPDSSTDTPTDSTDENTDSSNEEEADRGTSSNGSSGTVVRPQVTSVITNGVAYGEGRIVTNQVQFEGTATSQYAIEIWINGVLAGSTVADNAGIWKFNYTAVPLAEGDYSVTLKSTSMSGQVVDSAGSFYFNYDPSAPAAPTITAISNDSFRPNDGITTDDTLVFSGTSEANMTVRLYRDNVAVGNTTSNSAGQWSFDYRSVALADGTYQFTADTVYIGLVSAISPQFTVIVDRVNPAVPVISGVSPDNGGSNNDGITNTTSLSINGTAEANSNISIRFNGTSIGNTTADGSGNWSFNYSAVSISDGTYTIGVMSTDQAGNQSTGAATFTMTVDTIAPAAATNLSFSPDSGTSGDGVTNTGNIVLSGDAEANATVEILVNGVVIGSATADGSGNWFYDFSGSPLADGDHDLTTYVTDLAGNQSPVSETITVSVDTRLPATPSLQAIATDSGTVGDWITNDTQLVFSGTSPEPDLLVRLFIDGTEAATAVADSGGNWTLDYTGTTLSAGSYSVTVLAETYSGSQSPLSAATIITVDPVAPGAPGIAGVSTDTGSSAVDGNTSDNTLTVSGVAEASAQVRFYVDGVLQSSLNADGSGNWSTTFNPAADGNYSLTATATDIAGNTSASSSFSLVLDTAAPAAPSIDGMSQDTGAVGDWITSDSQLDISGTAEANARVEVFIDGVSEGTTTVDGSGNWNLGPTGPLVDGTYNFTAQAIDTAGNVSALSGAQVIQIDGAVSVPAITTVTNDTGTAGDGVTSDTQVFIGGTADADVSIEVFVDSVSVGTTIANGAGNWSFDYTGTTLADGSYSIQVQATDDAENVSALSGSFTLVVDNTIAQPTITGITDDTATAGDGITSDNQLVFVGTAEANASVEVFIDAISEGTVLANGVGVWSFDHTSTTLADGSYAITVRATDLAGNVSVVSSTFTLVVDTSAPATPAMGSITADSGTVGDGITNDNQLVFAGTAEANTTVTLLLDSSTIGTATADGAGNWSFDYTGTTLADNTYSLELRGNDNAGNSSALSAPFSLVIDTTNPAVPTVTAVSDDNGVAGDGNTNDTQLEISGTAEANISVEVFANGSSVGTTASNGAGIWVFDYTATTLAEGVYVLTAQSSDTAGNTSAMSANFNLTIDTSAPAAPVVASFSDDSATPGDSITNDNQLVFAGTAEANATVQVLVDGVPVGTTTTNGAGNWTFDYSGTTLADNTYAITATATDASGNTSAVSAALSVTVDATVAQPVVVSVTDDTGTAGDGITSDASLVISGTADANSTVTLMRGGVPISTSIVTDGAGNWSYDDTATSLAEGDYAYNATATDVAGNTSVVSATLLVSIDLTNPAVPVVAGVTDDTNIAGDGVTSDDRLVIYGTGDADEWVRVYLDGGEIGFVQANGSGNWSFNYTATDISDGSYVITAQAEDGAGNLSGLSANYNLTVDTAAPAAPSVAAISSDTGTAGDGITNDNTLVISGSAEANSQVTVLLDGGSIATVTANGAGTWSHDYSGTTLADNSYVLTATAQDLAGNTSPASANFNITIDTGTPTAPAVTAISNDTGTASDGITNDTTLVISGTGEIGTTIDVLLDGASIGSPTVDGAGNWTYSHIGTPLAEGSYTLTATQTDSSGNTSASSADFDITIDTSVPTVSALTPTDGSGSVGLASNLVIQFDEPITVQSGDIVIRHSNDNSALETIPVGDARVSGSGTDTLTINPTANLVGATDYYVQIATTAVDDVAANSYVGITDTTSWNFTSEPTSIISSTPADDATGVALNTTVVLNFNEPVFVNAGDVRIRQVSDNATIDTIDITSGQVAGNGTTTITITLSDVLEPNVAYYVEIDSGALVNDNNESFAGISGNSALNFTTANVTVPSVTNVTSPQANATYGAGETINVQVTFSENVNVSGTVTLTLDMVGTDAVVNYTSGTGTQTLTFNYTVGLGDQAADLNYVGTNSLAIVSGSVRSDNFANADLTLPATGGAGSLGTNKDIVVSTSTDVDLGSLTPAQGFVITGYGGVNANLGIGVSAGGDINGDGFEDVVVGSPKNDEPGTNAGMSYVVFGQSGATRANVSLSGITGTNGFSVQGDGNDDALGSSVSLINDLNGDGYDELLVAARGYDVSSNEGAVYVIWGKPGGTRSNIDVASFSSTDGFMILGYEAGDYLGYANDSDDPMNGQYMDSHGDFNGDGIADLILGHHLSDVDNSNSGVIYVIYGKSGSTRSNIDLTNLGANGFRIRLNASVSGQLGKGVYFAGDFNGDGYDDLLVGAGHNGQVSFQSGKAYVIFGSGDAVSGNLNLADLNGTNGFEITTNNAGTILGSSVASADVNRDGLTDLIVGAVGADLGGHTDNGAVHVIYGNVRGGAYPDINVDSLAAPNGYTIYGAANGDFIGHAVNTAGDFNGDGIDDLLFGCPCESTAGANAGAAWIIFGETGTARSNIDLGALDSSDGFIMTGAQAGDYTAFNLSHGDINGDGYSDAVIVSTYGDLGVVDSGQVFVVWGYNASGVVFGSLIGTAGAESLVGTDGNDIITGGGGADTVSAGAGDDTIIVDDLSFARIDGGRGVDTLQLSTSLTTMDLTDLSVFRRDRIQNIEAIDLANGANTLELDKAGMLKLSIYSSSLRVDGGNNDSVVAGSEVWFKQAADTNIGGVLYDTYKIGPATLYVHPDIDQSGINFFDQANFADSRTITFDGASRTVSNFPVLIALTDSTIIDATQVSGQDIRFFDEDGTPLPYEIERWDQGANRAEVWVLVPEVDNSGSDSITMYFDYPLLADGQEPDKVWADYTNVYHFHDGGATSGTAYDSTANGNHATQTGTVSRGNYTYNEPDFPWTARTIGVGTKARFNGSDALTAPYDASFNVSGSAFTVTTWAMMQDCNNYGSGSQPRMVRRGTSGSNSWQILAPARLGLFGTVSDFDVRIGGDTLSGGISWSEVNCYSHVTVVYDPSANPRTKFYQNGSLLYSNNNSYNVENGSNALVIGGTGESDSLTLDEVRHAKIGLSADYIRLMYDNQNNNGAFLRIDP